MAWKDQWEPKRPERTRYQRRLVEERESQSQEQINQGVRSIEQYLSQHDLNCPCGRSDAWHREEMLRFMRGDR